MNRQKKADLVLVIITFFWGIANPISDVILKSWQPMQLSAMRFLIAFPFAWLAVRKSRKPVSRATLLSGMLVGFLLSMIYMCAMYGIRVCSSVTTFSFIVAMPVILNPIINFLFRGIVPQKKFLISLGLSIAGLYLMTMKGGDFHMGRGEILALMAALCYSIDLCFTDVAVARDDVDPERLGLLQIGFGALFMTLISLFADRGHALTWTPGILAGVLTLAIGSTAVAFIAQPIAQQYTSSNHVGVIFSLEPVFSTLAAVLFLHEAVSARQYAGAVLMIAAVVLINVDFSVRTGKDAESA